LLNLFAVGIGRWRFRLASDSGNPAACKAGLPVGRDYAARRLRVKANTQDEVPNWAARWVAHCADSLLASMRAACGLQSRRIAGLVPAGMQKGFEWLTER